MDGLLMNVLEAHGGSRNWDKIAGITAEMSLGGPFWAARGWPNIYAKQIVTIEPHRERITFAPFMTQDRKSVFNVGPERVIIVAQDGTVVEERINPRESFPTVFVAASTPWDAIQVAYFTSAAVWNYLTEPFVFTYQDVEAREIQPWTEGAQTWRRLAVTFPKTIANHNANQIFYYDDSFMQRRMDYSPDVTGTRRSRTTRTITKRSTDSYFPPDDSCTCTMLVASQISNSRRSRSI